MMLLAENDQRRAHLRTSSPAGSERVSPATRRQSQGLGLQAKPRLLLGLFASSRSCRTSGVTAKKAVRSPRGGDRRVPFLKLSVEALQELYSLATSCQSTTQTSGP
jgi:hypothetical protein